MAPWAAWTILMSSMLCGNGVHSQDCGTAPLNTKIVGGAATSAGVWPWQVSLHFTSFGHICGATVISNQWLLTAAHCAFNPAPAAYTVYLGRENQTGSNPQEEVRNLSQIIVHPGYNATLLVNDIAILKMSTPVNFTDYIRPVCLAGNSSEFHNSTSCWSTGWGRLGADKPGPEMLQEVEIPVIGNKRCDCHYSLAGIPNAIKDMMICGGVESKGACMGDSGGPLQCKQNSRWIQAGVTSFGIPCATGIPEVYARISSFQDWITSQVGGSNVQFVTFTSNGTDPESTFECPRNSSATNTTTPSTSAAHTLTPSVLLVTLLLCHAFAH